MGQYFLACFVVPNKVIPDETPLEDFVVPLHEIEEMSGIEFFPEGLFSKIQEDPDNSLGKANRDKFRKLECTAIVNSGIYGYDVVRNGQTDAVNCEYTKLGDMVNKWALQEMTTSKNNNAS